MCCAAQECRKEIERVAEPLLIIQQQDATVQVITDTTASKALLAVVSVIKEDVRGLLTEQSQ